LNVFDGHQQEIYSLDFSRDGRLIVSGSGDKTTRIWDMHDGSCNVLTINDTDPLNNDSGVTSVAISPNGQLVAAGSLDTIVRIWDVPTGVLLQRLRGHQDSVYSVAFTPDGRGLVSGSLDKTLKCWNISNLTSGKISGKSPDPNSPSPSPIDFTGHKVKVSTARRFWRSLHDANHRGCGCTRITFFRSLCLMMANGSCLVPKTAASNSGIPGRQHCSLCCMVTGTLVCGRLHRLVPS